MFEAEGLRPMSIFGPFRSAFSLPHWGTRRWGVFVSLTVIAGLLALGSVQTGGSSRQGAAVAAEPGSLTGQFLVATDELRDPRFIRTVVYMVQHDAGGAIGLIVNRLIGEASLSILLDRLGMEGKGVNGDIRVHYGGPVEPARGFILHTTDYATEGTHVVKDGIAITVQPEILQAIGAGTGPRRSLFALGYAGWAPGQLEAEIKAGAWEIVPADEALVFDENYEKKWERAMARRTINL
jgi:putative transcriptional regulator